MRKVLLILLTMLALWMLGRAARRAMPAQERLLWALLAMTASSARVTANTAKSRATEDRVAALIAPVGASTTVTAPIRSAGNASFLAGLSAISGSLLLAGGDTDASLGHITGTVTTGNINTMIDRINGLLTWTFAMASDHNQVLNGLNASGYI